MQPNLFIDGYNLLHAAGLARESYGPGDLERARDRLLKKLTSLLDEDERVRTVVVFDAKESVGFLGSSVVVDEMTVVFPDRGIEADAVLEQMIRRHSAPRGLTVVSSDNRILAAARRRKANAIESDRFLARFETRATIDRSPEKPRPGQTTEADLEFWTNELDDLLG